MLWERKRCVTWGITVYDLHKSGKFLFPATGTLFSCVDNGYVNAGSQFPQEVKGETDQSRLNATMCPSNPDLIAFVGSGDIWAMDSVQGKEFRLTHCRKGFDCLSQDPLTAGLPSYVTQEEFNRYTGFWWRPVTEGRNNNNNRKSQKSLMPSIQLAHRKRYRKNTFREALIREMKAVSAYPKC